MRLVVNPLRMVFLARDEPRLRATWRFLLAWPLLPLVGVVLALVMPVLGVSGMIPGGPIQGAIFIGLLVVWARFIDRRPIAEYGLSMSRSWGVQLGVGFVAIVGVWTGWFLLALSLGWVQIQPSMAGPQDSFLVGVVGSVVSIGINSWVQDMVFFAIVLQSAAEGFRSRGLEPRQAVLGGWLVGILFFAVIHGLEGPVDVLAHAVAGAVLGALYVHTGQLALPVGVHLGASYVHHIFASPANIEAIPSWFAVTNSVVDTTGFVVSSILYVLAYLVVVGWLWWRRNEVTIETAIAQWTPRPRNLRERETTPQAN